MHIEVLVALKNFQEVAARTRKIYGSRETGELIAARKKYYAALKKHTVDPCDEPGHLQADEP